MLGDVRVFDKRGCMPAMWKSIFLTIVVVYLCAGALLTLFQRRFMYFPSDERPVLEVHDPSGAFTAVSFTTEDGLTLASWYARPGSDSRPVIVYFHGNAGHIGHRTGQVRPYLAAGFGVLLVGYRGYGGNPGKPHEQGMYKDARAALDWLQEQGIAAKWTVLYGESIGSGITVQIATEREGLALVLEAPFSSAADIAQAQYPIYPVRQLIFDRFDSASKIARVKMPVFVFHGERDEIIDVRFGRKLFDAAVAPKESLWLPDAMHNDLYEHGAAEAVIGFVEDLLDLE